MFDQLLQIAALASEKEVQGIQGTFSVKGNVLFFSRGQMIRVIQVPKFPKTIAEFSLPASFISS